MDYYEFINFVGGDMDMPTDEQRKALIESENSRHLRVCIGYKLETGAAVHRDLVDGGEKIVGSLKLLTERGAQRGKDYICTVHVDGGYLLFTLHTTDLFLSVEDVE